MLYCIIEMEGLKSDNLQFYHKLHNKKQSKKKSRWKGGTDKEQKPIK